MTKEPELEPLFSLRTFRTENGVGPNGRPKGTKRPCSGCIDFQMHVAVKPLP